MLSDGDRINLVREFIMTYSGITTEQYNNTTRQP